MICWQEKMAPGRIQMAPGRLRIKATQAAQAQAAQAAHAAQAVQAAQAAHAAQATQAAHAAHGAPTQAVPAESSQHSNMRSTNVENGAVATTGSSCRQNTNTAATGLFKSFQHNFS